MSLKPIKKSDAGKDWITKRRDTRRSISPEYHLIITEGTKTEPQYFGAIKKRINERFRERIQLEIFGEGDNTVNLFEIAKERVKESPNKYKHVWIVYDTDDFPKENIDAVPILCKEASTEECQYHAIWSNQCIELWYLLHFSYMHSDLHRTEYYPKISEALSKCGAGKYQKNRDDMFDVLEPYMDDAIKNAIRLQNNNVNKSPSNSLPGTKVYELVKKLKPYF